MVMFNKNNGSYFVLKLVGKSFVTIYLKKFSPLKFSLLRCTANVEIFAGPNFYEFHPIKLSQCLTFKNT